MKILKQKFISTFLKQYKKEKSNLIVDCKKISLWISIFLWIGLRIVSLSWKFVIL